MSKVLSAALDAMDEETRTAFLAHLEGGTSANWLSGWLGRFGHPVGSTTLKMYRAKMREEGAKREQ